MAVRVPDHTRERDPAERPTPRSAPAAVVPALGRGRLDAGTLVLLQRAVGNAATAELVEERRERPDDGGAGEAPGRPPLTVIEGGESPPPAPDTDAAGEGPAGPEAPAADGAGPAAEPEAEAPAAQDEAVAPPAGAGPAAAAEAPPAPGGGAAPAVGPDAKPGKGAGTPDGAAPKGEAAPDGEKPADGAQPGDKTGGGAAKTPTTPEEDPGFKAVAGKVKASAQKTKTHAPAKAKASEAQAASVPPGNDLKSQAAAAQVDEMGEQKPGNFDEEGFVAAVKAAVARTAPKTLEEADDFKGSGKAAQVKEEVGGRVGASKQAAEKNIKEKTEAPPDTSKAKPKEVAGMPVEAAGPRPPDVDAGGAMPPPRSDAEVSLDAGPAQVNATMAGAEVTEEQLQRSNEPDFQQAVVDKGAAEAHSAAAPMALRGEEKGILAKSRAQAGALGDKGLGKMHGDRGKALAKVAGAKETAKSADEQRRAKVATEIEGLYNATKADVAKILTGLDGKVTKTFDAGEKGAREAFESHVDERMRKYKDDRYSGVFGWGRWIKDKLKGMPSKVNAFYAEGRNIYLTRMDAVIRSVAKIVAADLNAARARIALGRVEIQKYVTSLPDDLQKVGKEAQEKIQDRFDELDQEVESKQAELVDSIAQKYVESRDAVDERIKEMKEANKGLIDKVIDAVVGVIKTILALKDMLLNILSKAAGVIGDIISDPIGFLGNLVSAVKAGFDKFVSRIGEHLQNALMDFLFGAVAGAGITLPKKLDFMGIVDLVLQILGLTYASIKARVTKIVGPGVMERLEQGVEVFKTLAVEGVGGLWKWIQEKLSNLEDLVLGKIKEFVTERIVKAGITWLISLLNPAAAFIKACKAIYDIIMFFIERGSQIKELIDSILDSMVAIAKGGTGAVADLIEGTLARILPVAISFLAALLGLGGISDKIREVIDSVRKPITKVVDTIIMGAVKWFKKTFGKAIAFGKKVVTGAKELGKKAVGKVKEVGGKAVRWAGEKLGLIKKPFSAAGSPHTVSVRQSPGGEPEVVIASTPQSPSAAVALTRAAAARALIDVNEVATATDAILKKGARVKELAREAMMRAGKFTPEVAAALQDLAQVIAACWEEIGFDGEHVDRVKRRRGEAGEVSDVGAHRGEQGVRTDTAISGPLQELAALESEHVVPWSWIDVLFSKLYSVGNLPKQAESRVYPKMTTVMIYAGAAKGKTSQALENSDMELLNFFRSIPAEEARKTLRDQFPKLVGHRMQIIRNETAVYILKVEREHGIRLPDKPEPATVRSALAAQMAEIFSAARELR